VEEWFLYSCLVSLDLKKNVVALRRLNQVDLNRPICRFWNS